VFNFTEIASTPGFFQAGVVSNSHLEKIDAISGDVKFDFFLKNET